MSQLIFISHPAVVIDAATPVPRWHLTDDGIALIRVFAGHQVMQATRSVWASTETKAIEGAGILAAHFGLGVQIDPGLDENDRSATGFLPPVEFQSMADKFFATPEISVRGWERAVDAQARIAHAFERITTSIPAHDIAIVGHGGTGTLLYCHLAGLAIDRRHDQPDQGHFWRYDLTNRQPVHSWQIMKAD